MSWTLESGACPQCQTENSIHIENCRSCSAVLPWSGSESTQVETFGAIGKDDFTNIPMWKRVALISCGALMCLLAVVGTVAAVLIVHRPPGLIAYILFVGGAALYKRGDTLR
jgi:hypothetical protein